MFFSQIWKRPTAGTTGRGGVTLTLDVPRAVEDRLAELAKLTGKTTPMEVIREALATYDALLMAQRDGARILVRRPGSTDEEVRI